ncbi:hypothetical protein N8475_03440 [Winogradskyella sp.]|nr:hypothetical protein [Winogradskyella sp.]
MTNTNTFNFFNQEIYKVGGKNTSLGEVYNQLNPLGINTPKGFALECKSIKKLREEMGITVVKLLLLFCRSNNIKVGLCDQAPSDIPAFAMFLD